MDWKQSYFLWKEGDCMTVIAQDVFTISMNLMEEESETGAFDGYPVEYKNRAWPILTVLQAELLPPSVDPLAVTSDSTVFQVDDRSAITILPYGLAAHLLMNEDQNKAAFFNARYDELKRKRPAVISKIVDVYAPSEETESENNDSVIDGGEF
jgi:hypothetical protein